ncbi:calcium-binding protein [Aeromonas diversa]|uniref:calcium-binding protein n=1 Tax=Aeromonas diversa TaxID=502790 RepID=UPI003462E62D
MESSINTASLEHAGELEGTSGADQLTGSSGDDTLLGFEGDDTLSGGEGNDQLFGDNGNNVLAGGRGDDLLVGGDDADVYLFGLGDGQDVIQDNALAQVNDSKAHDELRFGEGISPADLEILRVGDDLIFQHVNGEDSVTIEKWFVNERYWVERVTFADGTAWGVNDLAARVIVATGSERRETLTGWIGKDHLVGLGGNDILNGGNGDDSYRFRLGDGQDRIQDSQGNDTLQLEDIAADKLWFQRSDKDLLISVPGGADSITVSNWFAGAANQIETLVAGDGKRLLSSQVQALVDAMAAFNPPASGATSGQPGDQGELATLVSSSWQ